MGTADSHGSLRVTGFDGVHQQSMLVSVGLAVRIEIEDADQLDQRSPKSWDKRFEQLRQNRIVRRLDHRAMHRDVGVDKGGITGIRGRGPAVERTPEFCDVGVVASFGCQSSCLHLDGVAHFDYMQDGF